MRSVRVYYKDSSSNNEYLDFVPDKCPLCHHHISPIYQVAYFSTFDIPSKGVDVIWRCPNSACNRLFISYYENKKYKYSTPKLPEKIAIDEKILKISPRFGVIYQQALACKAYELSEIMGIGLRKALEILIKDYCIFKNDAETQLIKEMSLNNCIEKYCETQVKQSAHKCRVLGNDETHYERKYEQRDISDLEKLITITLYWIGSELTLESYDDLH